MKKKRLAYLAGAAILAGTLLGGTAIASAQDNDSASTTTVQEAVPSTTDDVTTSDAPTDSPSGVDGESNGDSSTDRSSTTDDEAKSDSSRREHGDRRGGCGEGDRSGERSGEHSDGDSGSADNTSTSATA